MPVRRQPIHSAPLTCIAHSYLLKYSVKKAGQKKNGPVKSKLTSSKSFKLKRVNKGSRIAAYYYYKLGKISSLKSPSGVLKRK